MNVLFLHQNFPAQFRHVAARFAADAAHRVVAIGEEINLRRTGAALRGVELAPYASTVVASSGHRYLQGYEAAIRRGQQVVGILRQLKAGGFRPDLVVAHPGWGEALFLRDVFADVPIALHAEYYYHATGADVGFDPEFPAAADDALRLRIKNTTQWMSMESADLLLAPTRWQQSRFPAIVQDRMQVVHDGIDTRRVAPDPAARISLQNAGVTLGTDDEVVTYVARNLEPYRGFHTFMRALPLLLRLRPRARILIVGGDEVSYGSKPTSGGSWRQAMLAEVGAQLDASRVHFLGRVPYADYLRLLQVSTVHAYLTYPFVLSWSLLEAMAAGCMVVASRTAPVQEVIRDGENGRLVDFFDHRGLAETLAQAIDERERLQSIRAAARLTVVEDYDLDSRCLPRQLELLQALPIGRGAAPKNS
jgi:glycosyltransferase involved in cell wall biosynthesis